LFLGLEVIGGDFRGSFVAYGNGLAMEEELTKRWGKFSLNNDENAGVSLDVAEIEPMVHR
jgi:hypothetical protein